jgi:hypothetical protein
MPAKDVTPTDEQREGLMSAASALSEDIHKRWPIWSELAKQELGKWSSPNMVIAVYLLTYGMNVMLLAQVPEGAVSKAADDLFDLYTDPDIMAQIAALRDDKKEILAFCDKIMRAQSENIYKRKAAN